MGTEDKQAAEQLAEVIARAAEIDLKRQDQIHNQRNSIERLLVSLQVHDPEPNAAADEITRLNGQLTWAKSKLSAVMQYANTLPAYEDRHALRQVLELGNDPADGAFDF